MDHEGAFTSEDNVRAVQRNLKHPERLGEETMLAAEGGFDNEDTPLLGGRRRTSIDIPSPSWDCNKDWAGLPWYKRPSIYWLLGPFVFSALAFGGIIVPKVNLILTLICREYYNDKSRANPDFTVLPIEWGAENPQCRIPEVQAYVARFTLYGTLISGLLSAVIAPKLGALSDRYGRKKLMMFTTMGGLGGEIITICAGTYPETFPIKFILLSYVLDGLCGSFIASMAISHSYATDCTPPERRNVAFAYFHSALFTGIALGPLIAGYVIKWTGTILTMFYIALGMHILFLLLLIFFIPESLTKARQMAAREKHRLQKELAPPTADWITHLRNFNPFEPLKILYPTGPGSNSGVRRNLLLLSAVDTIIFGVAMGAITVILIYSNYMFGWDTVQQSIFISIVNSARVGCLVVVLPLLTHFFGSAPSTPGKSSNATTLFELSIIRLGILCDTVGFLGYTLATRGDWFIASGALAAAGGMGSPTLQAALTKCVRPEEVGQLLGAMGLLHAVARVVSPIVFNGIYAKTVGRYTPTVFVILTVLFGVAFVVSWFVRPGVRLDYDNLRTEDEEETPTEPTTSSSRNRGADGMEE